MLKFLDNVLCIRCSVKIVAKVGEVFCQASSEGCLMVKKAALSEGESGLGLDGAYIYLQELKVDINGTFLHPHPIISD
jgi:hypothetical protein